MNPLRFMRYVSNDVGFTASVIASPNGIFSFEARLQLGSLVLLAYRRNPRVYGPNV